MNGLSHSGTFPEQNPNEPPEFGLSFYLPSQLQDQLNNRFNRQDCAEQPLGLVSNGSVWGESRPEADEIVSFVGACALFTWSIFE